MEKSENKSSCGVGFTEPYGRNEKSDLTGRMTEENQFRIRQDVSRGTYAEHIECSAA